MIKLNPADIYGESDVYFVYRNKKFTAKLMLDGTITSAEGSYTSLQHWLSCEYPGPCIPSVFAAIRMIVDGSEYQLSRFALYESEYAIALKKLEVVKTIPGMEIVYEAALQQIKADLIEKYGIKE